MCIEVEWSIQVGDFVCRDGHHLAQHIPIMNLFSVEVGFIHDVNTGECDTRIINNGVRECHKSGDIHSVMGCERCELGDSFKDGCGAGAGACVTRIAATSPRDQLEFRETEIIFLDNESATFYFLARYN